MYLKYIWSSSPCHLNLIFKPSSAWTYKATSVRDREYSPIYTWSGGDISVPCWPEAFRIISKFFVSPHSYLGPLSHFPKHLFHIAGLTHVSRIWLHSVPDQCSLMSHVHALSSRHWWIWFKLAFSTYREPHLHVNFSPSPTVTAHGRQLEIQIGCWNSKNQSVSFSFWPDFPGTHCSSSPPLPCLRACSEVPLVPTAQ